MVDWPKTEKLFSAMEDQQGTRTQGQPVVNRTLSESGGFAEGMYKLISYHITAARKCLFHSITRRGSNPELFFSSRVVTSSQETREQHPAGEKN